MKNFLSIILLSLFLTSCTQNTKKDSFPDEILLPKEGFNESFILEDIAIYNNNLQNNELFTLYAINKSENLIIFENNFQIELYLHSDNSWKKINNAFSYAAETITLPISKHENDGINIFFVPDFGNYNFSGELYVFIYGTKDNNKDELVGSFFTKKISSDY
ncbi:MAG: hypothetical protein JEZ00_17795 [Anaerolineaceae bacterium]|nr:hypothetical protein [Anaerolineaceae bacterium]